MTFIVACLLVVGQLSAQNYNLSEYGPINGWEIADELEVFNRENLFDRINGAAPLFLENNVHEMYQAGLDKGEEHMAVQVYVHYCSQDAFGMYAAERSSDMTFYDDIGVEAQGDDYGLYFVIGRFYVKIMSSDGSEDAQKTMQDIGLLLTDMYVKHYGEAGYPEEFEYFPLEGEQAYSKAYTTTNYIGHDFLKAVYTANYEYRGRQFQTYLIDGFTPQGARSILEKYMAFTGQKVELTEGRLQIRDRYNGYMPVIWTGRYIVGAFDPEGRDFPEDFYDFLNTFALP